MQSKDELVIACIAPDDLGAMWPHVGPLLLRGQLEILPDMELALKELLEHVLAVHVGKTQVWCIATAGGEVLAALTTEIVRERLPARRIVTGKGDVFEWRHVLWVSRMSGRHILRWGKPLAAKMVEFAKAEGCAAVRFDGRRALQKAYGNLKVIGRRNATVFSYERAVA